MSIRRWLAEKLCPELSAPAEHEGDRYVDPAVIEQSQMALPPGSLLSPGLKVEVPTPNVRIEITGPGQGKIWLNGELQRYVVGFSLECAVGQLNRLKIEYCNFEGEVVGDIDVADQGDKPE